MQAFSGTGGASQWVCRCVYALLRLCRAPNACALFDTSHQTQSALAARQTRLPLVKPYVAGLDPVSQLCCICSLFYDILLSVQHESRLMSCEASLRRSCKARCVQSTSYFGETVTTAMHCTAVLLRKKQTVIDTSNRGMVMTACMLVQLKDLKQELGALRVAKVTGGAPNKLSKM